PVPGAFDLVIGAVEARQKPQKASPEQESDSGGHEEPIEADDGFDGLDVEDKAGQQGGQPDEGFEVVGDGLPAPERPAVPDDDAQGGAQAGGGAPAQHLPFDDARGGPPEERGEAADEPGECGEGEEDELA